MLAHTNKDESKATMLTNSSRQEGSAVSYEVLNDEDIASVQI